MKPFALVVVLAALSAAPALAQDPPAKKPARPKREAPPEPQHPKDLRDVAPAEIDAALHRGVELLLARQESLDPERATKPEWPYEGVYRVRVGRESVIPVGYRVGGTSICAIALVDVLGGALRPATATARIALPGADAKDGTAKGVDTAAEARAAIERALGFVLEKLDDPLMTTEFEKGYDVRGWGHAYALAFLLKLRAAQCVPPEFAPRVEARIPELVHVLETTEIGDRGGWNYSRPEGDASSPSTFMTAPTLQILFEARRQGFAVDAAVVERALKSLEDARLDTGAFQYGSEPEAKSGQGFEDVPGSIGRSPVCETTLYLAGRGSVERIRTSLDQFFEHWRWLEQRRKQTGTHVPPYYIAPYYFYYAHRHAAQAIEFLPEGERAGYRAKLVQLLWHVREEDGGWNDRVFPRSESFGTAMTLLALREPALARPAGWTPTKPTPTSGGAETPKRGAGK